MSAPTTTTQRPEDSEREVFAPTLPALAGQVCDACGDNAVAASYQATKGDSNLFFCAHHIRKSAEKLTLQGFTFWPEDISFEAGAKK